MTERPLTAVGSYIFAGGFTLGVKKHFNVLAHWEADNYGVSTFKHNQPEIPVTVGPANWPLDSFRDRGEQLDLLYGNPPCAAWSSMGRNVCQRGDWRTDERVECTRNHFESFKRVRPRAWVTESVARAFHAGREFFDYLSTQALAEGYAVSHILHNARYLGCAQDRPRYFMVAHLDEIEDAFTPLPQRGLMETIRGINDRGPPHTNNIVQRDPALLEATRQGEDCARAFERVYPDKDSWPRNERGQVRGRPAYGVKRLRDDGKPGPAMVGKTVLHPTENRWLGINELKAWAGYPADYEFLGSVDAQARLMARAVMPPVGAWLAGILARGIRRGIPAKRQVNIHHWSRPPFTVERDYKPQTQPGI